MSPPESSSVPLWRPVWKWREPDPVIVDAPDEDVLLWHLDEDGWD